ncbi:CCA tRNA nucleotidyltransferase [Pseudonocardia sp. TMWB2A]|uniref:CCA tRNA nucleotidyltransferase n=1 Tax=Pseudonocardia sp. TMWB2A TaxID=687430 RepID=UPI00307E2D71
MKLPASSAFDAASFRTLAEALGASEGRLRIVGGAVRDTLMGIRSEDVDLATPLLPQEVTRRAEALGAKVIPTGIAHGTVTIVYRDHIYEVTTLRRDVSTDGRRATVAFSDDWKEDASRRDFTINALYADPLTGEIFDYFGGLADLEARRVRFIGEPQQRIAEDYLRILRYFRFHARFGEGPLDTAAYEAVARDADRMMGLSRERVADELLKLLALPDPVPTLALMDEGRIWRAVLPEADSASVARVAKLVANEQAMGIEADAVRRLVAFLPEQADVARGIASKLKLSNIIRKRIVKVRGAGVDILTLSPRAAAHALGIEGARDLWLIDGEGARLRQAMADLTDWTVPRLPIGGGAIVARGIAKGPDVARLLQRVEAQWVAEGFPDAARVEAIADDVVAGERE